MTPERLMQRCAARIRLNELLRIKQNAHLLYNAGSEFIDSEIFRLESELRRREGEA